MANLTLATAYPVAAVLLVISVVCLSIRVRLIRSAGVLLYSLAGFSVLMADLVVSRQPETIGIIDYVVTAVAVILLIVGAMFMEYWMKHPSVPYLEDQAEEGGPL